MKTANKSGGNIRSEYRASMHGSVVMLLVVAALTILSCDNSTKKRRNVVTQSDLVLSELHVKERNVEVEKAFIIEKDTSVEVLCVGEGVDYSVNKFLIKSYDNDCVEIYFDLKNEKTTNFDVTGDDRQYRVVWKMLSIDGINNNNEGVIVNEIDPANNRYIIIFTFPWKTLGYVKPAEGVKIGFDVAVDDNDLETRKALVSWHSKSDLGWKNTSMLGTLILSGGNNIYNKSFATSRYTEKPPLINSETLEGWEDAPKYDLKNVIFGKIDGDQDLSGKFQSKWDENNLYVLIDVRDNVKNYAQAMFDYGWISTAQGKLVWKMKMDQTSHAGGALKNRYSAAQLKLRKGEYVLHYISDESHAPNGWDDAPPTKYGLHGIKVSYLTTPIVPRK